VTPQQIRELRIRLQFTQQEMAGRLGLRTRGAVAHLESGRRAPTGPVLELLRLLDGGKKIQKNEG
jgi:transcriptional regulator with XRE-family HTH domain